MKEMHMSEYTNVLYVNKELFDVCFNALDEQ